MSTDRFITWGEAPEWGPPTAERLAAVAISFLGEGWTVGIRPFPRGGGHWLMIGSEDKCTFHLASERPEIGDPYFDHNYGPTHRGFQVYFPDPVHGPKSRTSVITRHYSDSFTSALADRYTDIIARWWNGEVDWPS